MIHTMATLWVTGKVRTQGECHIWTGALAGKGYPVVADDRERYVHRLVLLMQGRLDPGQQSRHRCGVGACINPEHLLAGSQSENERDKVGMGRDNRGVPGVTHCGRHLAHGRCKRHPHDGPCKPDIFEATYEAVPA